MASHDQVLQNLSENPAQSRKNFSIAALASVITVTLLVGSEVFAVAFGAAWAAIGLTHLGGAAIWVFYGLAFAGAMLATGWFAALAWNSEMRPASPAPADGEAG